MRSNSGLVVPKLSAAHIVAAHDQVFSHKYVVHYADHTERRSDPFYKDFRAYKKHRKLVGRFYCDFAVENRGGDFSECQGQIECHHRHIEYAMQNEVDLKLLEAAYPGVSTKGVGKWVESADNLVLYCAWHHRGPGGVHMASASDWEAERFIRHLISKAA